MLTKLHTVWVTKIEKYLNKTKKEPLESRSRFQIDSDGTKHVVEKMDKNWLHLFQKYMKRFLKVLMRIQKVLLTDSSQFFPQYFW